MKLPDNMKTNVTQDPPLLQHIEVEYEGYRAYTTIGTKDNVSSAVEVLACMMLHVKTGTDPRKVAEKRGEKFEADRRRKLRRARRLERRARRGQET